jgi:hypothetical protein
VLLADDVFRLVHHHVTGRPRLHPRAVAIGLAAALLAELLWQHRIHVQDNRVYVLNRSRPADPLADMVLFQLSREPWQHTVREWLAYWAEFAPAQVAARLERAGQLRARSVRRLLRGSVVYVPVSQTDWAGPWAVLATRLSTCQQLPEHYVWLAGMMTATGLDKTVLDGARSDSFEYLSRLLAGLPDPVRELLGHAEAAIGDAVLAHRT